jgi:hypothetical protein
MYIFHNCQFLSATGHPIVDHFGPPRVGLASDLLTPQSQELRRLLRVVSLRAQRFPDGLGGQNRTDVWAFCPYALRLWLTSA